MQNILIRTGISPLDNFDPSHMITKNSIGGNVGNLVYAYGVFRTLMTEGTTLTPNYYENNPENADEINERYDCFVLPLADAFRSDFVPEMRKLTQFIKKLKIPVIIIGVGLRAPYEPNLDRGFAFDEDVKAFVRAVLEKSSIIGVRGEITSSYLSKLGFREGVDHTVIGCPSMYTFGRKLNVRETNITPESLVCVNSSRLSPKHVLDFITRSMEELPNHYFIPQWLSEMVLVYTGSPSIPKSGSSYPGRMSDPVYMNNRVRFFLNVPTWLDFLRQADLSFGARLHGNIAAVLSGTPSIIIAKDARMRELIEYHHLTHIMAKDLTKKTNIMDLVEKCDFQEVTKVHGQNFDRFIQFLDKNHLDHIYKESETPSLVPLDNAISKITLQPPLVPISGCTLEEMVRRWESYYPLANAKKAKLQKKQDAKLAEKNQIVRKLQAMLNRKSVRLALKLANKMKLPF